MAESLIALVVQHLCPGWEPPEPNGKVWLKVRCPFHMEDHASAAVSYELDCFTCQACPARGNAVTLLAQQKGITFRDASRIAETLAVGGDGEVPSSPPKQPSRRIPFQPKSSGSGGRKVRPGIRGRSPFWA